LQIPIVVFVTNDPNYLYLFSIPYFSNITNFCFIIYGNC